MWVGLRCAARCKKELWENGCACGVLDEASRACVPQMWVGLRCAVRCKKEMWENGGKCGVLDEANRACVPLA